MKVSASFQELVGHIVIQLILVRARRRERMAFRCCGKPPSGGGSQSKATEKDSVAKDQDGDKHAVLTDMKEMFKMFDADQNGLITKEEVVSAFKKLKIPIMAEEILYMFMTYDTNGDNQLNYSEFSSMMKDILQSKEFPVEDMFKYFDSDDDGYITVDEFLTAMHCLGIDIQEPQAREMCTPHFTPGTDQISYENFLKLMKDLVL